MPTAAEIRAMIANGQLKAGGRKQQVGAGNFKVVVDGAEFAIGENGNPRGKVVCRVIGAAALENIGRKFNIYIQTTHEEYLMESIAEWTGHCTKLGISEQYIFDRAEDGCDIMFNIMTEINRLSGKGAIIFDVDRKESDKISPKFNKPYFWNDILSVEFQSGTLGTPSTPPVPVAAPVPQTLAAPTPAPVAPAPVAPAPAATPAPLPAQEPVPSLRATNTALAKKPWQR